MNRLLNQHPIPPPPPLPKYDPSEEAPKWNLTRFLYHLPPVERGPDGWTKTGVQPESSDKPDWRGVIRDKVIELPMPGPYEYGAPNDPKYFWFDTPDYADPFKKLYFSLKFFVKSGLILSCAVGGLQNASFTLANNMKYLRTVAAPWILAGMAGSMTVIALANLRGKKDDLYNYTAAGFVMASILGRKNHKLFFRYAVIMPPLAIVAKYNAEINGALYPYFNNRTISWSLAGYDTEHGPLSGDFRLGIRGSQGEPGRDVRRFVN